MAMHMQDTREMFGVPLLALTERNRTALERTMRVAHHETLHFLNKTLQHNVDALEGLRKCRGLPGLMAVEHEWMSCVMRDSMEQTQRMAKVWWEFAEEEIETQAEEAHDSGRLNPVAKRKVAYARKARHHGRKKRA
jgi:hypothetical protein